ncbi:MAG: PorT family protein [Candidatus Kapabacteria bacterium]|nr:PorT family protein [Candidatus Kapabacteria bacterium]
MITRISTACRLLPAIVSLLVSAVAITAQTRPTLMYEKIRLGLAASVDQRFLQADFPSLPKVPTCCLGFGNEQKTGYSIDAVVEVPLSMGVTPYLRAMYTQLGGDFSTDEKLWAYNGELTSRELTVRHDISATVHAVFIEPGASFNVLGFDIGLGIQCGYITGTSFTQKESIVSPNTITYVDGSRERNIQSGFLSDVRHVQFGVNAGIGYDFTIPNMPELSVGPELQYTFGITDILYNTNWRTNVLRLGLAVKYAIDLPPTYHERYGR